MITLKSITAANFEECIQLKLTKEQQHYIATNTYSLAESYAMINDGTYTPMPYAIYSHNIMVGFIMAIYDANESTYYISRLMIDTSHQGNGYGKQALLKMIEVMKTFPHGHTDAILLSCSKANVVPYKLYESVGFMNTGNVDEAGDCYMKLTLKHHAH
ncbi:GNAT family N-acetyltransferase [Priestia taiwanensis]|uniref:N-acetyltransferase n=1 Tax=Priestia taiwanensis TaxID=1347902 RepID=A0A917ENG8_9BACI|nr:GNAT family N-acetyltransferase [Priestia taiwanensis]MBM7362181.1 diamine N-acetyltransferase [Priestia taiwanensis]GGE60027.1 N-acetyltransferase [Priestia taiwanensis]